MAGCSYILLLNDSLKRHILTYGESEKRRLFEKFDYLANGIWDAGIRIKKLKGLSRKVIFEARLTRARRILFTLGRNNGSTLIYLWGIVKHDDINSTAGRIIPENAPFLNFEPVAQEERADLLFDELDDELFSQESIEERSGDDHGPQKWLVLNEEEWRRLLGKAGPDDLEIFLYLTRQQRAVLDDKPPLLLSGTAGSGKTTISVYYLLNEDFREKKRLFLTCSAYLKRFSARIYNGLIKNTELEETTAPDFYVFRDLLKSILDTNGVHLETGREVDLAEFKEIYSKHELSRKYDAELVWEEIRAIIKGAKPPISAMRYREMFSDFKVRRMGQRGINGLKNFLASMKAFEFIAKIERILDRKTGFSGYDDFLMHLGDSSGERREEEIFLLGEILKIIEKKTSSLDSPLLSYVEYCTLGKKRAPNFLYDRKDIYSIAEYYQNRLADQGLYDEIDLCRKALSFSGRSSMPAYDLIVCDEVQDFADIQLELVFSLVDDYRNTVFAGDPKQIINPSGFRWEEIRSRFYERGVSVPDVFTLNLNFRCVGSIVRLSNALLDLKQRLIGLAGSELREDWKFNGQPPFLVHGLSQAEMLERVALSGAGRVIIVRSSTEQKKLKKALRTELIFTITEAKGLEFDTVLIWKFSKDRKSADIWRRIRGNYSFDQSHAPHIRHEINLLYVAVTRARNTLIIYDGKDNSDIWDIDSLKDKLYRTSESEAVVGMWQRISTPGEWEKQGDYFLDREYYPAAVECFRNAGVKDKLEKAQAYLLKAAGDYERAAELFTRHGHILQAAESFEKAGNYERAATLWKKKRNNKRARICRILAYEKGEEYNRAADEWEKLKDYKAAFRNWEKAGNHLKMAGYYLSGKDYQRAVSLFERARDHKHAAECYKKLGIPDRAADRYFEAGEYRQAAGLYKKLKNRKRLIQCHTELQDYYAAAVLYEKSKNIEQAVKNFRKFIRLSAENREKVDAEAAKHGKGGRASLKAAVRYSALSDFKKSAPIFFKKKYYDRALHEYQKIGDSPQTAACFSKSGRHYEAALEYERSISSGNADSAAWQTVTTELIRYINQKNTPDHRLISSLYREADTKLKTGAFNAALARYRAINDHEGIYRAFLGLKRDEEALEYYFKNGDPEHASLYLSERGNNLRVSLDFLESLIDYGVGCYGWDPNYSARMEAVIKLIRICLTTRREETLALAHSYLESVHPYFDLDEEHRDELFKLMLEAKNYNSIFSHAKFISLEEGGLGRGERAFFSEIERIGREEGDANLLAVSVYPEDRQGFEKLLADLEPMESNTELFAASRSHYTRAVDFLLSLEITEDRIERGAAICTRNHDYARAARIYRESGNIKAAAERYLEAREYDQALACYRELGDKPNTARTFEKMGNFRQAVEIWEELGRLKEAARVARKREKELARQQADKGQLELF